MYDSRRYDLCKYHHPHPHELSSPSFSLHSQINHHNNNLANPSPNPPNPTTHTDDKNPNPHHHHNNLRLCSDSDMAETTRTTTVTITNNANASSSAAMAMAMAIDGSDEDSVLSKSEFLTRQEVLRRRSRRLKQLSKVYKDYYWSLMEDLKLKYREYYWEYGKSPFQEDEDRENLNRKNCDQGTVDTGGVNSDKLGLGLGVNCATRCGANGCKSKPMALTKFCHTHILSDGKQKLYKGCNYVTKSSQTGPLFCGKPILSSTVPSLCPLHFQKAEKHVARALKKAGAGLNVASTSRVAPKFHVIVAEYVSQIQTKRRAALKATTENTEIKEDINH